MDKVKIKKAFGFLIIVIAIGMVGIEFILSIFNSYGAQLERRILKFRNVRRISTNQSLQLVPKLAKYHDTNMLTAGSIYYRIARRKAATVTAPSDDTSAKPEAKTGTSGGGGQVNLPAVNPDTGGGGFKPDTSQPEPTQPDSGADTTAQPDDSSTGQNEGGDSEPQATQAPSSAISSAMAAELEKLFKSNYSPNKDDLQKFKGIVSGLSSDAYGKIMKTVLEKGVSIDKILSYNNEFFSGVAGLLPKLDKEQKQAFYEALDNEYAEFNQESMQRIAAVIEYYKSEQGKKLKHKLTPSLFKSYSSIFGNRDDNINAAIKYLISKELDLQSKMRYLTKPLYKIASYVFTIAFLLSLIAFIFRMEMSRVFIMFTGVIKVFFLLTVPIIVFHGITGLLVLFSIAAIVLTFISMYIVDLRVAKQAS